MSPTPRLRPRLRLGAGLLGLVLAIGLLAASTASAFIYWVNTGPTIGRAGLNGSSANQSFINTKTNGCGVAVTRNFIYWTTIGTVNSNGLVPGSGTIGRAKRNGSSVNSQFIKGLTNPCGIAVSGTHIYWANTIPTGGIGRASISGRPRTVDKTFIPTDGYACGVAVNGTHVFWGNRDTGAIGRAKLSGGGRDQSFVSTASNVCLGAVNRTHIFWTAFQAGAIGRAAIGGNPASVNPSFISANRPCGVTVDRRHVYWASAGTNSIGRANLNGSSPNQSFITGANIPCWVAVDPPARRHHHH
jgi:hypothetical protein